MEACESWSSFGFVEKAEIVIFLNFQILDSSTYLEYGGRSLFLIEFRFTGEEDNWRC